MKGANLRAQVRITFEEAVFGVEKELELTIKEECPKCHGVGAKPGSSPETCSKCGEKLVFEDGCKTCKNCGESYCG